MTRQAVFGQDNFTEQAFVFQKDQGRIWNSSAHATRVKAKIPEIDVSLQKSVVCTRLIMIILVVRQDIAPC